MEEEGEENHQYGANIREWDSSQPLDGLNGFYLQAREQEGEPNQAEERAGGRGRRLLAFGTYGNRQGLHVVSDGPYTLFMEW